MPYYPPVDFLRLSLYNPLNLYLKRSPFFGFNNKSNKVTLTFSGTNRRTYHVTYYNSLSVNLNVFQYFSN